VYTEIDLSLVPPPTVLQAAVHITSSPRRRSRHQLKIGSCGATPTGQAVQRIRPGCRGAGAHTSVGQRRGRQRSLAIGGVLSLAAAPGRCSAGLSACASSSNVAWQGREAHWLSPRRRAGLLVVLEGRRAARSPSGACDAAGAGTEPPTARGAWRLKVAPRIGLATGEAVAAPLLATEVMTLALAGEPA